jgi:hypothetical protein
MLDTTESFETQAFVPDFVAPELPEYDSGSAAIEAADRRARHWTSSHVGPLTPGTDLHKREVCRMFRETFNPYRPSVISWPTLSDDVRQRITSLPIWDIAHKTVLSKLVGTYGIPLASEPPYQRPRDAEWAYMVTGYSECIDSSFAFGLFETARRSGLFPEELVETFEPVMQDECRHILLFANWVAWHRAALPWWRRPFFELRVAAVWVALGWERLGLARSIDGVGNETVQDHNFTVTGATAVSTEEFSLRGLLLTCLAENERRFSGYDARLRRPTTMPKLVRFLLRFLRK